MAVPTDITDLDATASNNSPSGSDTIGTSLDDYMRAIQAIVKQNVTKGADIASTGTPTIPNAGNYFVVTGTNTITGFNDTWNGRVVTLKFSDALTLTSSASLIMFGSDVTTEDGDTMVFVNESAGVYRCLSTTKASGAYITADSTDTLTNKTIVAVDNTITTASSGTLTSTELDAVIAEIASEILSANSAITANSDALDTKQATITGGATTIDDTNLTASRALVSDGSGKVAVSSLITTTELERLNGVTSAVQTQLNAKANLASPILTGSPRSTTQASSSNTTYIATTAFCRSAISAYALTSLIPSAYNSVGSTIFARYNPVGALAVGSTTSGANLTYSGASGGSGAVSVGTWRLHGYISNQTSSVWIRTA